MSSFPDPDPNNIDYFRDDAPDNDNRAPRDVDYFGHGRKAAVDPNKMLTSEEIRFRLFHLNQEINEANGDLENPTASWTIEALVDLYSRFVSFFEEVLKSSTLAHKLAEGISHTPPPTGLDYEGLIRESFRIHGVDYDEDEDDQDPEEEEEEEEEREADQIRATELWSMHKDQIAKMTNVLNYFNDFLFENSRAGTNDGWKDLGPPWSGAFAGGDRRAWQAKMKAAYDTLRKPLFSGLTHQIWDHLFLVGKFLRETAPDSAAAWKGGVLQGNQAFETTFRRFRAIGDRPPETDAQRKGLLRSSAWLLQEACSDLQLDPKAVDIEWEKLVDPLQMPAYIRCPIDRPTFTLGTEEDGHRHPGIMHVKRALGCDPEKDPQAKAANAGAVQANTSKRRQSAEGGEAGRPAKRRQTEAATQTEAVPQQPAGGPANASGHAQRNWLRADADAELRWIESWLGANPQGVDPADAPVLDGTTVLKPLLTKEVCARWAANLGAIRDELADLRDRVLAAPATEEEEEDDDEDGPRLLDELEAAIAEARAQRDEHLRWANRYSKKWARVYAIRAVYLRALAVRRAAQLAEAEGGDGGDGGDLDEHRARRLEDWVAHEQAWRGAELARAHQSRRAAPQSLYDNVARLEGNVAAWTREIEILRARVAARQVGGCVDQARQPVQPPAQPPVAQPEATEAAEAPRAAPSARTPQRVVEEHHQRQLSERDRAALARSYGGTIFESARLFRASRWRDGAIYNRDETDSRRPGQADGFRAGGPEGHEGLPTGTTWEKLQYMIVLTHWRFQKAWEMRL